MTEIYIKSILYFTFYFQIQLLSQHKCILVKQFSKHIEPTNQDKLTPDVKIVVLLCFPSNIGGFTGIPA